MDEVLPPKNVSVVGSAISSVAFSVDSWEEDAFLVSISDVTLLKFPGRAENANSLESETTVDTDPVFDADASSVVILRADTSFNSDESDEFLVCVASY